MAKTTKIIVERLNPNDDKVRLVEWKVKSGSRVSQGEIICTVETSKALFEVAATESGYLHYAVPPNREVAVGGLLAVVSDKEGLSSDVEQILKVRSVVSDENQDGIRASGKAKALAAKLGVDLGEIKGRNIIREADVEHFFRSTVGDEGFDVVELSPIQLRTSEAVSRSHASIPMSTVEHIIEVNEVKDFLERTTKNEGYIVSLLDLAIHALATTLRAFPEFNSRFHNNSLMRWRRINIAFAVESRDELFLPCIADCDQKSLVEIARAASVLKYKAAKGGLSLEELQHSTIAVTSLHGSRIHRFQPVIHPDHSCILGIGDVFEFARGVHQASFVLSFDHRLFNASKAARFLVALCDAILSESRSHESI